MTIECKTFNDFMDTVEDLVKRGLMFNANGTTWVITLTGGY
ncbi:hypothetical protein [Yersinia phage vB_YenP_AP10]|uniref:Uncharacterized protein n=1 Tax=Yersinia phage vB_YenP_AP10 TaxID=1735591 RepID=A0A0P0M6B7_9CAUD|nr:hypothetical protein AU149_gp06 [Yersinia phage vB_YenP_AP10]ALK86933.1 hypothetical protein [Yersinia phage vB_YenP_AP10]